jgi:hypothetical protein
MWQALRSAWGKWRESRRQYALDRALHKAGDREHRRAGEDASIKDGAPPSGGR